MALIQCPECEKEVSEDAEVCPNCGYVLMKKHSALGIIGIIIAVISWFGDIYFWFFLSAISLVLCIIGCMQKNKKHVFPIIGNIISIVSILICLFLFITLHGAI